MSRTLAPVGVPTPFVDSKLRNPGFAFYPTPTEFSAITTVTADATPHTAGAWTEVIASTAQDATWMTVTFNGMALAGTDTRGLLDVGFGAAASEVAKLSSIPVGFCNAIMPSSIMLPIWCPRGTRVSARLRALITIDAVSVRVAPMREPRSGFRSASFVDTLGADTAGSKGTNLPTSDTYVEITAATTQPYRALIMAPVGGSGGTFAAESSIYTLAVGASGSEVPVGTMAVGTSTSEIIWNEGPTAVFAGHFPLGTRIAVKQSVGRNYRDVVVFGVPYS